MRRFAILFLLISSPIIAQQTFSVGLKEGVNTSQVAGDTYAGFDKFGMVGGAFLNSKINSVWSTGFEIIYSQKGSRHRSDFEKGDYNSYFLQLNYIEVPLLFKYYIQDANIEFGPGISFLVKTKELISTGGADYEGVLPFNKQEFNFNIGASYTFSSNFGFNLRYTNSFIPIRKTVSKSTKLYEGAQLNNVISLCLTYQFNPKIKAKN